MAMKDFSQMNLTLVGIDDFNIPALYCIDNSPLQNQTLFPGCFGICANPDVSGIVWLAVLTPDPSDTLGAMLAAIAASWTIFAATLASYGYNNITFHHTLICINLSNLPTVAFFAGILRLRLQPGTIPLGPKLFATPILVLQFIACGVSIFLGVGLNAQLNAQDIASGKSDGAGAWQVAQPQCNADTQLVIFGRNIRFWEPTNVTDLSRMSNFERIFTLVVYGIIIFLPFVCSFICLYVPETGTLKLFAATVQQKSNRNLVALGFFFILSNGWTILLIYATEIQIRRNNVLPGENIWGAGQILAMVLIAVPLLGFLNIAITSIGNHSLAARRWIKRSKIHRIFGIRFETDATSTNGDARSTLSRNDSNGKARDLESGTASPGSDKKGDYGTETDGEKELPYEKDITDEKARPDMPKRLSKAPSRTYARPEDLVIVVPGQDSEPEEANKKKTVSPGSAKSPNGRNSVASGTSIKSDKTRRRSFWKPKAEDDGYFAGWEDRRPSDKAVSPQSPTPSTPRGRLPRSVATTFDEEGQPRRRLSKRRPDSLEAGHGGIERSASLAGTFQSARSGTDGYWSAAEDQAPQRRFSRRRSSPGERPSYERSASRASSIGRGRGRSLSSGGEVPKYIWTDKGWVERSTSRKRA